MPDLKSLGDQIAKLNRREAVALAQYLYAMEDLGPSACASVLVPSGTGPGLQGEAVPELENEDD